jgi:hypothetical protein
MLLAVPRPSFEAGTKELPNPHVLIPLNVERSLFYDWRRRNQREGHQRQRHPPRASLFECPLGLNRSDSHSAGFHGPQVSEESAMRWEPECHLLAERATGQNM